MTISDERTTPSPDAERTVVAIWDQVALWLAALVLTWLTHEAYLHRKTGVLRKIVSRETSWTTHLIHGLIFVPSYVLLFLAYQALLGLVVLLGMAAADGGLSLSPGNVEFFTVIMLFGLAPFVGGFLFLRWAKRRKGSVEGMGSLDSP